MEYHHGNGYLGGGTYDFFSYFKVEVARELPWYNTDVIKPLVLLI
jgi:hypothetical protein